MALEDEIINIEDLEIASEIKIGDFVLLETTDGTKLIDFKDFIIGADNVTFFDKISGTYLQTSDISAISAKTLNNESLLSSISGVNSVTDRLQTRINSVESSLITFIDSLSVTSLTDADITSNTNAKVGFTVSNASSLSLESSNGKVRFATIDFKGTGLTEGAGADIYLGDTTGNNREGFFYKAKGSYGLLLNGMINVSMRSLNNATATKLLYLKKNDTVVASYALTSTTDAVPRNQVKGTFNFSIYINLVADDKITLTFGERSTIISEATFSGIRVG